MKGCSEIPKRRNAPQLVHHAKNCSEPPEARHLRGSILQIDKALSWLATFDVYRHSFSSNVALPCVPKSSSGTVFIWSTVRELLSWSWLDVLHSPFTSSGFPTTTTLGIMALTAQKPSHIVVFLDERIQRNRCAEQVRGIMNSGAHLVVMPVMHALTQCLLREYLSTGHPLRGRLRLSRLLPK